MVTSREPSCPALAPAADDPRQMILSHWPTAANVVPNVNDRTAAAESRTSWGRPFRVSLSRAAPPAISSICLDRAGGAGHGPSSEHGDDQLWQSAADDDCVDVVAAHGNSVLFKMSVPYKLRRRLSIDTTAAATDYFLYRASASGPPPSLSLLPTCHIPMHDYKCGRVDNFFHADRVFHNNDTGESWRGRRGVPSGPAPGRAQSAVRSLRHGRALRAPPWAPRLGAQGSGAHLPH